MSIEAVAVREGVTHAAPGRCQPIAGVIEMTSSSNQTSPSPVPEASAPPPTDSAASATEADTIAHAVAHTGCQDGWNAVNVTRSLLGWGAVAGPFYVIVSLAQALSRDGFELTRHQWSLLENGDLGWVQVANFLLTGVMLLAFSVGLRRALHGSAGGTWSPLLIGVFGLSLMVAGVFRADPALGFPPGTPPTGGAVSSHGVVHFAAAGVGFLAVAASCFVLARRFSGQDDRRLAAWSRATGAVFLAGFLCVASGAGSVAANLAFTGAVVLVFGWLAAVALHLYRMPTHLTAAQS
jgi:hypothetical protein